MILYTCSGCFSNASALGIVSSTSSSYTLCDGKTKGKFFLSPDRFHHVNFYTTCHCNMLKRHNKQIKWSELFQLRYDHNTCVQHNSSVIYITFSINCVLESMRKSLKTECKQLSVALVSRIRLSNCFSISCVFDSILWEKSWRNRKSFNQKTNKKKNCYYNTNSCRVTFIRVKQSAFHKTFNYSLNSTTIFSLFGIR